MDEMTTEAMLAALGWLGNYGTDPKTAADVRNPRLPLRIRGIFGRPWKWKRFDSEELYESFEAAVEAAYNAYTHKDDGTDFLDEVIAESEAARPGFAAEVDAKLAARVARRELTAPLYRRTIEAFGKHRQEAKITEELAELTAAFSRFFANDGETPLEILRAALVGEWADAEIVMEQGKLLTGITDAEVAAAKAWKLARLERLVKAKEERTDSIT